MVTSWTRGWWFAQGSLSLQVLTLGSVRGGIQQRPNGSWKIVVDLAPHPTTGRRRQKTMTVWGSRRDAEEARAKFVAEVGGSRAADIGGAMTVDGLFERWIAAPARGGRARSASSRYQEVMRYKKHVGPHIGQRDPRKLRAGHLTELYDKLLASGLAPNSVRRVHQQIGAMLAWAAKREIIDVNPAPNADVPGGRLEQPWAPEVEVVEAVLAAARATSPEFHLIVRLAAITAGRRSELVALRWDRFDLEGGTVRIEAGELRVPGLGVVTTDTKTGERATLSLDAHTLELLRERRAEAERVAAACGVKLPADAYVFGPEPDGSRAWHPTPFRLAWSVCGLGCRVPSA